MEWDFSRRGLDGEVYHGFEGWLAFARQFSGVWQEFHREVEGLLGAGDSVVVFSRDTGRAQSGVEVVVSVGQVLTFRDGKIITYRYFGEDRQACLDAAGLGSQRSVGQRETLPRKKV